MDFVEAVDRAMESCKTLGINVDDHFREVTKMVVYILPRSTSGRLLTCKNPSFREDRVKIGKSSRPMDVRSIKVISSVVPDFKDYKSNK